eukprot:2882948-Amphidinium_carterae.1
MPNHIATPLGVASRCNVLQIANLSNAESSTQRNSIIESENYGGAGIATLTHTPNLPRLLFKQPWSSGHDACLAQEVDISILAGCVDCEKGGYKSTTPIEVRGYSVLIELWSCAERGTQSSGDILPKVDREHHQKTTHNDTAQSTPTHPHTHTHKNKSKDGVTSHITCVCAKHSDHFLST